MIDDRLVQFEEFVKDGRRWLYWQSLRLCGEHYEAEDLVQVVLYKLFLRWEMLTRRDQLLAYCRQALVHAYFSERRKLRSTREVLLGDSLQHPISPDSSGAVEDRIALASAVRRLPPRQRAVVVLRFWHEVDIESIAHTMGCTASTVRSQTSRALRTLGRELCPRE
jgi:RNA polymerase sigma-70 factor (sigma-E family)